AQRRLTLTQPNRSALHAGFDSRRLDAATTDSVRTQLHGHYLQTRRIDCVGKADQLTCELEEFVRCVRTGNQPRVDGAAGRDAIALATRILDSLRAHAWTGDASGPCGPSSLPAPLGALFTAVETKVAA